MSIGPPLGLYALGSLLHDMEYQYSRAYRDSVLLVSLCTHYGHGHWHAAPGNYYGTHQLSMHPSTAYRVGSTTVSKMWEYMYILT